MFVSLLGASGVVGRHLAPLLAARGHSVRAVVRDPARAATLAGPGVAIAQADLFDAAALTRAIAGSDIVVNVASAVPRPGASASWDANTRIRTEGTRRVIEAAAAAGVGCIVHQSVAMVHQSADGAWVDEASPLLPHPQTQSAIDLEEIAAAGPVDWRIVRGGLFYGPGTGREDFYRAAARDGTLAIPGDGSDYLSPIHIEDMASAVATVVEHGTSRSAWLAVDDRSVTWRDFIGHVCATAGLAAPTRSTPNYLPSFRCRNDRLRSLGWRPRYIDIRAGLA